MKKIVFLIIFFLPFSVFASGTPIEKVFDDIGKDYKYYNELQTLYNKGIFFPNSDGKFAPQKLLTREEFFGIISEVTCKKCIKPNESYDYLKKYFNSKLFFDVKNDNKYFYCIAGAYDLGLIKGYGLSAKCENGSFENGKSPFCPKNIMILDEALAVSLRASNILTNPEAEKIIKEIENGSYFPDLSEDLKSKLPNGDIYSFYPYFKKALEYEVIDYDTDGKKKTYKLLEKTGNNLNPRKPITREDFLKIAYVLFKGNSCIENNFYNLGLKIKVLEETCNKSISSNCKLSKFLKGKKVFDFMAEVSGISDKEEKVDLNYIWRFYNFGTKKEVLKYGKYLNNYEFLEDGNYRVYLTVRTDDGKIGQVYNDFSIGNTKSPNLSIESDFIYGNKPLKVNFTGKVSDIIGIKSYSWDFGDGETSYGLKSNHIFKENGNYNVNFIVELLNGDKFSSSVLIRISDSEEEIRKDSDNDGVIDSKDRCINIFGEKENYGCPIFEKKCETEEDCFGAQICSSGFCKSKKIVRSCEYSGGNLFYGNVICETCPCDYSVDFNAKLRNCDVIFPAITSPDGTTIYSKGDFYEIRK